MPKRTRWLEFCYSPIVSGYFIYDWTIWHSKSYYKWFKIQIGDETYHVMGFTTIEEATQELNKYLWDKQHERVIRVRLD
jgi:hypothetical protein